MRLGRRDFALGAVTTALSSGCVPSARSPTFGVGGAFLDARLAENDTGELVVTTDAAGRRRAAYDAALVALVLLRRGRRDDAARVLLGVARSQRADGAVPFSLVRGAESESARYVRSGAVAWCGYAAAELLDAGPWSGPLRERVVAFAHRVAAYLLARRTAREGDVRHGLVAGGEGTYVADVDDAGRIAERFVPGICGWVSTEHNVDAYFFFRRFGPIAERTEYVDAAAGIRAGLLRLWRDEVGQLVAGADESGPDATCPLDAAAWGALFLASAGEEARARRSAEVADARFGTRDPARDVAGHRPFAEGAIFANARVAARFSPRTWDALSGVWPEGSAGVALAALRTGNARRATAILDGLEPLREGGALPTFTRDVPLTFDVAPSVAGTAWVELVRYELARPPGAPTLWT